MSIHPHQRPGDGGLRQLALAMMITALIMVIEIIAGLISGSLALLADAGHMVTDTLALGLSLFAAWMAARPATPEKTYGYYRTEILAALINGIALCLLVVWIALRALQRLQQPPEVLTGPMLAAACLGLAANLISGRILFHARMSSLNVQGAWLHVLSDALGSVGVITAGLLIRFKGWRHADPLVSLFIGGLIAINAWLLVKRSVNILLEGTPAHLSLAKVIAAIREVNGVVDIHDLHLWTITTGMEAMSGHVTVDSLSRGSEVLSAINHLLAERFGITHTTFQLEDSKNA
ncbi:MAG: cation transporter [Candidatus Omnitrophica bacterium]|nr:cation transporter [Candidatus Omnitrophota bacterium]